MAELFASAVRQVSELSSRSYDGYAEAMTGWLWPRTASRYNAVKLPAANSANFCANSLPGLKSISAVGHNRPVRVAARFLFGKHLPSALNVGITASKLTSTLPRLGQFPTDAMHNFMYAFGKADKTLEQLGQAV